MLMDDYWEQICNRASTPESEEYQSDLPIVLLPHLIQRTTDYRVALMGTSFEYDQPPRSFCSDIMPAFSSWDTVFAGPETVSPEVWVSSPPPLANIGDNGEPYAPLPGFWDPATLAFFQQLPVWVSSLGSAKHGAPEVEQARTISTRIRFAGRKYLRIDTEGLDEGATGRLIVDLSWKFGLYYEMDYGFWGADGFWVEKALVQSNPRNEPHLLNYI